MSNQPMTFADISALMAQNHFKKLGVLSLKTTNALEMGQLLAQQQALHNYSQLNNLSKQAFFNIRPASLKSVARIFSDPLKAGPKGFDPAKQLAIKQRSIARKAQNITPQTQPLPTSQPIVSQTPKPPPLVTNPQPPPLVSQTPKPPPLVTNPQPNTPPVIQTPKPQPTSPTSSVQNTQPSVAHTPNRALALNRNSTSVNTQPNTPVTQTTQPPPSIPQPPPPVTQTPPVTTPPVTQTPPVTTPPVTTPPVTQTQNIPPVSQPPPSAPIQNPQYQKGIIQRAGERLGLFEREGNAALTLKNDPNFKNLPSAQRNQLYDEALATDRVALESSARQNAGLAPVSQTPTTNKPLISGSTKAQLAAAGLIGGGIYLGGKGLDVAKGFATPPAAYNYGAVNPTPYMNPQGM